MSKPVVEIRNAAIVGHANCGKTSLGEAMLHATGVTSRLGSVDDGSSMLDFDDESRERKQSVDSSVFYIEHKGALLNLVDTPGSPDYLGPALAPLAGVDSVLVVVSAVSGVEVNTRRMFNAARDLGLARLIVVNKMLAENAKLDSVVPQLRETFGTECLPVTVPTPGAGGVVSVLEATGGDSPAGDVADWRTALMDAIAESDDALMESYMETGDIPAEQLGPAFVRAVSTGHVVPIFFTDARKELGVRELLDHVVLCAPSPASAARREIVHGDGASAARVPVAPDPAGKFLAQVFKITSDPKSGIKYSVARVHAGTLRADGSMHVGDDRKAVRPGHIFKLRGNQHAEIPEAAAGDIVAFAKLDLHIGTMLAAEALDGAIPMPRFPTPMYSLAVEPRTRSDVDKMSTALTKFTEEDPCFQVHRDARTHELVIAGLGDQHLTVIRNRMRRLFKLEVDTKQPKIPYLETITGSAKFVDYTHKKQTGGAGQYARVVIDVEPAQRGADFEWEDKIFGGSISQPFRPAVQKGIRDQMKKGVIAGYPVVDVKVALVDGKEHPVDSKDIAFQIAGREVFKKAVAQCRPILLEPIVHIDVTAPQGNTGDITRDLAGKRGQILGQEILPGGQVTIRAQVPLSEVANYNSQLKSVTGGQGSYSMELSHYDPVPPNIQQQIVAAYKPHPEEE